MHILLTGGTGLIGRQLCRHWLAQGHRLSVWSRRPEQVARLCGAQVKGVALLEELGQEFVGQVEEEIDRLKPLLPGCLDQPCGKPRLGQNNPDGHHGWRTWTEVKGKFNILLWQAQLRQFGADLLVDTRVIDRTGELDLHQVWVTTVRFFPQPLAVKTAAIEVFVREEMDSIKWRVILDGGSNGADIFPSVFSALKVRSTNPGNEPVFLVLLWRRVFLQVD